MYMLPTPPSQQLPEYTLSPPTSKQWQRDFVFKHSLTANISVSTCCGKTYFCKMFLQHCRKMIWQTPKRTVRLYKRWQPLYDDIQKTVYPRSNLFNKYLIWIKILLFNQKCLVILDDLMSTASKDSRMKELFQRAVIIGTCLLLPLIKTYTTIKPPTREEITTVADFDPFSANVPRKSLTSVKAL